MESLSKLRWEWERQQTEQWLCTCVINFWTFLLHFVLWLSSSYFGEWRRLIFRIFIWNAGFTFVAWASSATNSPLNKSRQFQNSTVKYNLTFSRSCPRSRRRHFRQSAQRCVRKRLRAVLFRARWANKRFITRLKMFRKHRTLQA